MKSEYFEELKFKEEKLIQEIIEDCEFVDCDFENCTFEECSVVRCKFTDCRFFNCNIISLRSKDSEIKRLEFTKCNLIGVHWHNLLASDSISGPVELLKNCYLKYNSFVKINFRKFDFSGNAIQESVFEECNLMDSSFSECKLEKTQVTDCDIRNADFRGAMGYQIDIATNRLKGARFSFPEVVSLLNGLGIKIE